MSEKAIQGAHKAGDAYGGRMGRRAFLQGLIAAGVAAGVPLPPGVGVQAGAAADENTAVFKLVYAWYLDSGGHPTNAEVLTIDTYYWIKIGEDDGECSQPCSDFSPVVSAG